MYAKVTYYYTLYLEKKRTIVANKSVLKAGQKPPLKYL